MDLNVATAALIIAVGLAVGMLSALLGIGGGIVMVPFMVLVLGLGQQEAEGTSLLVIVPTAIAGTLAHRRSGYVSFGVVGMIALGGVIGAWLGARSALALSGPELQRLFGALVVVIGGRLLYRGVREVRSSGRPRT